MVLQDNERIEIISHENNILFDTLRKDVFNGLTAPQKYIPTKYLYDAYGSSLFEKICHLPEYYLTRTELSLLEIAAPIIMQHFHKGDLIEFGSGSNKKIKFLLDAAYNSCSADIRYVPIDVSKTALIKASLELLEVYPEIQVLGIVSDFTRYIKDIPFRHDKLFVLFGSTIGNLNEKDCVMFLKNVGRFMRYHDRFLLGIDMVKSKNILEPAYNDSQGITSEFNKNILNVINRRLDANFHLDYFDHYAFFNEGKSQIEMHLKANHQVKVSIKKLGLEITMEKGETIHTEISRKFTRKDAENMVSEAGLAINRWFTDQQKWFSLIEICRQR